MAKFCVEVRQLVEVEIDDKKLDEKAMAEYRESYYGFHTLEQHACHIAQMCARGLYYFQDPETFVEGYGQLKDYGISAKVIDQEEEIA